MISSFVLAVLVAAAGPALAEARDASAGPHQRPVQVDGATPGVSPPAPAAEASAPEADIVVSGRRISRKEYRDQIETFVRETGVAAGQRPAARWLEPVCPSVLGLAKDQAARVQAQLRKIAQDAGIPVARDPCRSNIAIAFTDDANGVVRSIHKRSAGRLAEMSSSARASLLEGNAPVRWWYTTDIVGRFGGKRGNMSPTVTLDGVGHVPGSDRPSIAHYTSSIVSTQEMRSLESATVVVDIRRAAGVSLQALASYAALVAFAEINARDAAPNGSLLGRLAPGGPEELTDMDLAFLRSLYQLSMDREAHVQRRSLVDRMTDTGK